MNIDDTVFKIVFIVIVLGFLIGPYVNGIYLIRRRWKYLRATLQKGEIDLFISEINKDIERAKHEKLKNILLVNKTVGLIYKSDWQRSLSILKSIDSETLPMPVKKAYYNNLIFTLILLGKIEEADKLFSQYSEKYFTDIKDIHIKHAIISTYASLEFYKGNIIKSKEIFTEITKNQVPDINLAGVYYMLGKIYLKEENHAKAIIAFETAIQKGRNTFYEDESKFIMEQLVT